MAISYSCTIYNYYVHIYTHKYGLMHINSRNDATYHTVYKVSKLVDIFNVRHHTHASLS